LKFEQVRGIFPLATQDQGIHPLVLGLRFDPVALPLDQTAELKTSPRRFATRAALFFITVNQNLFEILPPVIYALF
jgi:hypothetical protein